MPKHYACTSFWNMPYPLAISPPRLEVNRVCAAKSLILTDQINERMEKPPLLVCPSRHPPHEKQLRSQRRALVQGKGQVWIGGPRPLGLHGESSKKLEDVYVCMCVCGCVCLPRWTQFEPTFMRTSSVDGRSSRYSGISAPTLFSPIVHVRKKHAISKCFVFSVDAGLLWCQQAHVMSS